MYAPAAEGRDLIGRAKTGSGKTLAFALPVVEGLLAENRANGAAHARGRTPRAMIMAPTRELANQVRCVCVCVCMCVRGRGGAHIHVMANQAHCVSVCVCVFVYGFVWGEGTCHDTDQHWHHVCDCVVRAHMHEFVPERKLANTGCVCVCVWFLALCGWLPFHTLLALLC